MASIELGRPPALGLTNLEHNSVANRKIDFPQRESGTGLESDLGYLYVTLGSFRRNDCFCPYGCLAASFVSDLC